MQARFVHENKNKNGIKTLFEEKIAGVCAEGSLHDA